MTTIQDNSILTKMVSSCTVHGVAFQQLILQSLESACFTLPKAGWNLGLICKLTVELHGSLQTHRKKHIPSVYIFFFSLSWQRLQLNLQLYLIFWNLISLPVNKYLPINAAATPLACSSHHVSASKDSDSKKWVYSSLLWPIVMCYCIVLYYRGPLVAVAITVQQDKGQSQLMKDKEWKMYCRWMETLTKRGLLCDIFLSRSGVLIIVDACVANVQIDGTCLTPTTIPVFLLLLKLVHWPQCFCVWPIHIL